MELVINSLNNKKLSILKFEILPPGEKEIVKKKLICFECRVQAFYRRKTKDGKQACFYAKHASGCGQGMSNPSNVDSEIKEEVNKINVVYNELILSLDQGNEPYEKRNGGMSSVETAQKKHSRSYTIDPSKNKSCKITLKKILKYAIHDLLDDIDIPIIFEGKSYKDPFDLIIHFKDVDHSLKGEKRIFWGEVNSISSNKQFLNCGAWDGKGYDFSILLSENISNSTKLKKIHWNKGVYCIFIATLYINKYDKPYIRLNDINLMALETK
ncbi:hypothetical protein EL84_14075 [Paenibacillus sp. VT-400]|uniref:hypothetical protein n=1 Tax=Paenibacillus sp. VT-400 TaxID=1495853 RepID=UPI000649745E|nr:hypothetical protein [Paenibacillus sp. VT-400]KLU53418.1 hypothetical protein EL84_14075 [Paenibacillus sp. VT-400]